MDRIMYFIHKTDFLFFLFFIRATNCIINFISKYTD